MTNTNRVAALILTALVATGSPALAAKDCEVDLTSRKSILKSTKACGFTTVNQGVGKKTPAPKKIAIAGFQIRFDFDTQEYGTVISDSYSTIKNTRRNRVEFETEVHQEITEAMYDMFVATLEAEGYEVVPAEKVIASETYAMVKADDSAKEKQNMVRTTARGLKNIKGKGGAGSSIAASNKLAGLNKELDTDAVVTVFSTLGLVKLKGKGIGGFLGGKKKSKAGVRVCLGTRDPNAAFRAGAPFLLTVLAGTKESKMPGGKPVYMPKSRAQVTFNNSKGICHNAEIQQRSNKRWAWSPKYESDLDSYIDATVSTFGWASEIGLIQFDAAANK